MPNLLDQLNLEALSDIEQPETSLIELLLGITQAQTGNITTQVVSTQQSKKNQAGKKTRSSRKTASRRANTRQKARRAPPMQVSAQLSLISDLQEKNNQSLESYKLQAASTSLIKDTLEFTGTIEQAASSTSSSARAKVDGVDVHANMRPVILAFMDYLPIANKSGNNNEVSNIINMKINARQLALENLPEEIKAAEQATVNFKYLDEYKRFLKYREIFFDNLDVSKIGADDGNTYREALSFLEISSESAGGASNTPILLTFLRDYANAVMTASPRLLELPEVEFGGGTSLASRRSTNSLRVTLKSTIDYIRAALGEDREIALKSLAYQLGSELKLSRNTLHLDTYDANEIFETPLGRGTMLPSATASSTTATVTTAAKTDSFGIINSIQNRATGDMSYEFPFEIADILGLSAAEGSEILSAPDFIRQVLAAPVPSMSPGTTSGASTSISSITTPVGMAASVGSGPTTTTAVTTPSYVSVTTPTTTISSSPPTLGDTLASYDSARDAMGCASGMPERSSVQLRAVQSAQPGSSGASGELRMMGMGMISAADTMGATPSIQYEDPYTEINTRALEGISRMERLVNNSGYSISGVPSTIILKLIVDNVVEALVAKLFNDSGTCDTIALAQLLFLDLAAKDQDIMGQFLLYLTRLEEKLNQPIITQSSDTVPVHMSTPDLGGTLGSFAAIFNWAPSTESSGNSWLDSATSQWEQRMGGGQKNPMVSKNTLISAMSTPTQVSVPSGPPAITELSEDVSYDNQQTSSTQATSVAVSTPSLSGAVLSSAVVATAAKAMAVVAKSARLPILSMPEDPIDTIFEDLCTVIGQTLYTKLESSASTSSKTSNLVGITPENITRALMVQSESAFVNQTLKHLLSLFQTVVSNIEGGHGGVGSFHSNVSTRVEETRYSSIPRGNMEVAFYEAVVRTTNVIFSNKYEPILTATGLAIKVKSATASRLGGRLTDFIQQEGMYLTSGGSATWSTAVHVGGPTTQIEQSRAMDSPALSEVLTGQVSVSAALDDSYSVADESATVTVVFDRVYNALVNEEKFVEDFPGALRVYFSNVNSAFTSCKNVLSEGISDDDTTSLKNLALRGLEICPDMYTNLHNIQQTSNSDTGMLNGVRTREVLLDDTAKSFMLGQLKAPLFTEAKDNIKFMSVGIPAGMLEALSFDPVAITDLARNKSSLSKDYFEVRIEKIDLTRPERNYKAKTFVFPRRVLFNSWNSTGGGPSSETGTTFPEIMIAGKRMKYDVYNEDTYASLKTSDSVDFLETYHSASMINLKNDIALKLYSDVLYNLDFNTSAFPTSTTALEAIICPTTIPLNMELVDLTSDAFRSGSCLAFMDIGSDAPTDYEPVLTMGASLSGLDVPVMSIPSMGTMSLAGTPGSTLSVATFPFFDFVSTVGDTVVNGQAEVMFKLGTTFERALCIPFDPSDFEVEMKTMGSGASLSNIINQEMDLAEETVPYGLETSQGVELCTFRVSVVIPDEGEYEQ